MLAINAINYYTNIRENLLTIEKEINFLSERNPILIKANIVNFSLKEMVSERNSACKEYINGFKSFKRDFEYLSLIEKTFELKKNITSLFEDFGYEDANTQKILVCLDKFLLLHQDAMRLDSHNNIISLFDAMEQLVLHYRSFLNYINGFIDILTDDISVEVPEETRELEIQLLDVQFTVGEFAEILQHLDAAYSSLASLIPDVTINQLQIFKIESGSLLSKVLGDDNIIEVLGDILKKITVMIYHRFTKEGKLELNNKMMHEVSNSADLIQKLDDMGIDTSEAKDNIKNVVNVVTNELSKIALKTPRIKIDNEIYFVGDTQKYLECSIQLLESKEKEDSEK